MDVFQKSRFLARTISTIQDKKTKAQEEQLATTLHPSLASDKNVLQQFSRVSENVRQDARKAEKIRHTLKRWREHMADIEGKLHSLGSKFRDFAISWKKRDEDSEGETKIRSPFLPHEKIAQESKLSHRSSVVSFCSLKEVDFAEFSNSADKAEKPYDLTEDLLNIISEVHDAFGEKCLALEHQAEQSLASRWTAFVKGDVRDARYHGHEFFRLYAEYQQSVRALNQIVASQQKLNEAGESPPLKPNDLKRLTSARKSVDTSKSLVFNSADSCENSFGKCQTEWECGHVPFGLLIYLKTFKKSIQDLNTRINELFPDEQIQLIEKKLNKNYEEKKKQEEKRYDVTGKKEEKTSDELEAEDGWQESSVHGLSRPNSIIAVKAPVLDCAPQFSPPPPPALRKKDSDSSLCSLSPPPSPISLVPGRQEDYYSQVSWPSVGEKNINFIKRIMNPNMGFWISLCKSSSSPLSPNETLPMILPINNNPDLSLYDAIKIMVKIASDTNALTEWLGQILFKFGDKIIVSDLNDFVSGNFKSWEDLEWPTIKSYFPVHKMAFVLMLHIFWITSRTFIDKTIKEIVHGISQCKGKTYDEQESLKKKTFRVVLGQKGFLTRAAKECFLVLKNRVSTGGVQTPQPADLSCIAIVLFEHLLFPTWNFFGNGDYKVDGINSETADVASFVIWTNQYKKIIRKALSTKDDQDELCQTTMNFLSSICSSIPIYTKPDADLWMLSELINSFEASYCNF